MSELAVNETGRLAQLEQVIERGLATFVEVGSALLEIRDSTLYRRTHSTFDSYCRERWGFSKQYAHLVMAESRVNQLVDVQRQSHARELAPLIDRPDELRETWAEVRELHSEPTAADVREVVQRRGGMDVHYSSEMNLWSTPQDLFDELHHEFGFTLDVCATPGNAKCASFFTEADDGLTQEWRGVCWMNPPYGDVIGHWVEKAYNAGRSGATVVCLVPARVDTGWWWNFCRYGEVRFLRGRLKFGGGDNAAPFPSALVVFGRPANILDAHWERAA